MDVIEFTSTATKNRINKDLAGNIRMITDGDSIYKYECKRNISVKQMRVSRRLFGRILL